MINFFIGWEVGLLTAVVLYGVIRMAIKDSKDEQR